MADSTITLNESPWRNVDVSIFNAADVEAQRIAKDPPSPAALKKIPVTTEGSFDITVAAVKAYRVTGSVAANNAIRWTAKSAGAAGNSTTVRLVDPAGNSQSLGVSVTGAAITVNLATNGGGTITSTATAVRAAIAGDTDANALVDVANEGASSGAGVVAAVAVGNLTYGGAALAAGKYAAVGLVDGEYRYRHFAVQ